MHLAQLDQIVLLWTQPQLAVEKGLNDRRVQRGLRLCSSAVAAFSQSWKKQRDLVVAQEQKGLPIHKLKVDVVTRWAPHMTWLRECWSRYMLSEVFLVRIGTRHI